MIMRFNSQPRRRESLWLLLTIVVFISSQASLYCYATTEQGPQVNGNVERKTRQADLIDEAINFVGRALNRGAANNAKPSDFFSACPNEPVKTVNFQNIFMLFHRPGDASDEELRLDEENGAWNQEVMDSMISDYDFDLNKPTLMYTGGYMQDSQEKWLMATRNNYNELAGKNGGLAPYNLLFLDWSRFSFGSYGSSVGRVPLVAEKLANFFEYLHAKHGYDLSKVHLISFSLSTHIAGLASRKLAEQTGQQVGQITYMDPTGVCFHDGRAWDKNFGAHKDDASFTVARHYNMFGLGSYRLMGGLDILINDGSSQPKMDLNSPSNRGYILDLYGSVSSHLRAAVHEVQPFKMSSECHEMAYACPSIDRFRAGECGSCGRNNRTCYLVNTVGNIQLGRDPKTIGYKLGTKMFLSTGKKQFCAYQYQVVVNLAKSASSRRSPRAAAPKSKSSKGTNNNNNTTINLIFEPFQGVKVAPKYRKNDKMYQLITLDKRMTFKPKVDMKTMAVKELAQVSNIEVNYLSHVSPAMRASYSFKYCPDLKAKTLIKCT